MDSAASTAISGRDSQVLDLIFGPATGNPQKAQPADGAAGQSQSAAALASLDPATASRVRSLEAEGIQLAESDDASDPSAAIARFTEALSLCPESATLHNNRAQAYRMQGDLERALADLDDAVRYASNGGSSADLGVLRNAYTQRAVVLKGLGRQDESVRDWERAAQLGSDVAKTMAVAENPFAQMCNAIMKEVMAKYQ
ncbi:hypothetical protein BC828DRAFT_384762 [Blastocladiella britannica]|nr:hypothetical protein BC828DRAFT_384762 [Blastocladiella britannica]